MLPDRVSNPGPLTYESGALPIALRSRARQVGEDSEDPHQTASPSVFFGHIPSL